MVLELKNRPSPRSPSFTTPVAVMNTLAGLISGGRERRVEMKKAQQGAVRTEVPDILRENTFEFCFGFFFTNLHRPRH